MRNIGATTDGVVSIRPSHLDDRAVLIAGRDDVSRRFLGEGSPSPQPTVCIVVGGDVVGWVDVDTDRDWLLPGEGNLGYNVFERHRGRGYGTRAVKLFLHCLALRTSSDTTSTSVTTATLLVDPSNHGSLALARRCRFERGPDQDGQTTWKLPVPPLSYGDGVVTLRPPRPSDLDMDLSAKDDEQMRWLWLPGQRESWDAMDRSAQREHARRGLDARIAEFGSGPKWIFSVDAVDAAGTDYVAYVDCDLANDNVPAGEVNLSYSTHPAHRGNRYARRAVALACRFLRDHTGARTAHIITEVDNHASRRVADGAGATARESFVDTFGRTMLRHVVVL